VVAWYRLHNMIEQHVNDVVTKDAKRRSKSRN
jgi:hypothetical protein